MFGGIAFIVAGNMACGVMGEDLIVRLGDEEAKRASDEDGVRPFDFTGRADEGTVYVSPERLSDDGELAEWVDAGADYASSLPPKWCTEAFGIGVERRHAPGISWSRSDAADAEVLRRPAGGPARRAGRSRSCCRRSTNFQRPPGRFFRIATPSAANRMHFRPGLKESDAPARDLLTTVETRTRVQRGGRLHRLGDLTMLLAGGLPVGARDARDQDGAGNDADGNGDSPHSAEAICRAKRPARSQRTVHPSSRRGSRACPLHLARVRLACITCRLPLKAASFRI